MPSDLADRITSGDARAIARGISLVEDDADEGEALVRTLYARTGDAFVVGVTGAPGAGKSTLVDALVQRWRAQNAAVGVIAVDPTSPFSGGAMLGDRVRMQAHARDAGVFIRSMATRGHLGGLARATADAATVLAASGKQIVAIETVGVGQDEVDIVRTADVSLVVLVPGMGDDVQALKAGVMEIADVFIVNKADREGAERTAADIESVLSLKSFADGDWRPPIVKTVATTGQGVDELLGAVASFRSRADLVARRRRDRASAQIRAALVRRTMKQVESTIAAERLDRAIESVALHATDPYSAAESLLA